MGDTTPTAGAATTGPGQELQRTKGQTWEPTNLKEGMAFAEWLSRSSIIPRYLIGKPHDIMVVALAGRDYGLTFTQAMSQVIVVEGRVALSAALIVGLVKRHPECEYFRIVEADAKHAIWETKRRGHPAPSKRQFTIEDAARMGLANRDNWKKQPETMLTWRAATHLARFEYPDVVLNLMDIEEAGDSGLLRVGPGVGNWQPPEAPAAPAAAGGNVPAPGAAPVNTAPTTAAAPVAAQAAPAAAAPAQEAKRGPGRPRKAQAPAAEPTHQPALGDPPAVGELVDDSLEDGDALDELEDDGPKEALTELEVEAMRLETMEDAPRVQHFGQELVATVAGGKPAGPPDEERYRGWSEPVRVSYWMARLGFAANEKELRGVAAEIGQFEPKEVVTSASLRKAISPTYNEKLRQFGGGAK